MKKRLKKMPILKTEDEVRKFWDTHDSTDYIDWAKASQGVFPNLQMTSKPISIRMTTSMINQLKLKANRIKVPYQALIKQYVEIGLREGTVNKYRP